MRGKRYKFSAYHTSAAASARSAWPCRRPAVKSEVVLLALLVLAEHGAPAASDLCGSTITERGSYSTSTDRRRRPRM